jgi:hypothetical protein
MEIDEECSPNKVCRNMQEITIELTPESWKEQLVREGKWR